MEIKRLETAADKIKESFKILLVIAMIFFFLGSPNMVKAQGSIQQRNEIYEGVVTEIMEEGVVEQGGVESAYQRLRLKATDGPLKGREVIVENGGALTVSNIHYNEGEKVVFTEIPTIDGKSTYIITDHVRRDSLLMLFIIFVIVVIAVGKQWGAASILGMLFSFLIIFRFILPMIVKGYDAVLVAIVGSALIIPVTFSLSHGYKKKTLIAISGTLLTLIITGILAAIFVELTHLTGFASEEASFLQFELGDRVNMKGILLAGMIIASLGVLDDITISQASVVRELKSANKKLSSAQIFKKAMKVGTDHISSLVNTLVLVYTGASLPLLLLFINDPTPFYHVINYEIIADEIVRTLVGSIGLVLAVPITTFLAVRFFWRQLNGSSR